MLQHNLIAEAYRELPGLHDLVLGPTNTVICGSQCVPYQIMFDQLNLPLIKSYSTKQIIKENKVHLTQFRVPFLMKRDFTIHFP